MHRDIKPENLVFDSEGYLYVTDFGISQTFKGKLLKEQSGTPSYMAPEIFSKIGHSFTADYYAVGVILHEMIIGKRPYPGRNRKDVDI